MSSARSHSGWFFVLPPIGLLRVAHFLWPGSALLNVQPLCTVLMLYPWDQNHPLGSIGTRARGVGVTGGVSDASMYSVNWRCNLVMRVVDARSSAVSVAFVVDIVTSAWGLSVVAVERFASSSAWFCSIFSCTTVFPS